VGAPFSDYQRELNTTHTKIAEEVEDFYLSEEGEEIEVPDAYWWLVQTESYGLLFPGSYVQQPCFFMRAIEAARAGRTSAQLIAAKNKAAQLDAENESINEALEIARRLGGGMTYGT
jgi:hypothetical protein